uniref:LITAF domain-containing protein n=1 Tax=Knipowitschia caucasica TaxID=637954 RepID=A0AAV2LHL2_KNICA
MTMSIFRCAAPLWLMTYHTYFKENKMDKSTLDPPPYSGPGPGFAVQQQVVVVSQSLPTDSPGEMMCPQCRINVVTMTEYKVGTLSWLIGGIIFLTCFLPFCWIPFCVPSCKDVKHTCPRCHTTIHVHKRL